MSKKRAAPALSVQVAVALSFSFFVLLAAGVTGYISQRSGRQSVQQMASRMRGQMSAHIVGHVRDFLNIPHVINRLNSAALSESGFTVHDPEKLEQYFRKQIDAFSSVSSIYFGNVLGGLVNSGREPPRDSRYVIATEGFTSGTFRKYSIDNAGKRISLLAEVPDFDARTRIWYTSALRSGGGSWSSIYVLFTGQDMAITASRAVFDARGNLLGVTAVDLFLAQLSSFLQTLYPGQTGKAFIMERTGLLVASSSAERPLRTLVGGGVERFSAMESMHQEIRAAAKILSGQAPDNRLEDTMTERKIETKNGTYFLQASHLYDAEGIDWIVVVLAPENEYMAPIEESNRVAALLILATICIAIFAAVFLARRMARPILRLNAAAGAIARGEAPSPLPVDCGIVEIRELSRSFNRMSEKLRITIRGLSAEIAVRKEAENRLRLAMERAEALRKEAEAANRAKSEFLANMSHEIRTPLNGVIGFIDMLHNTGLDEERRGYLENVKISAYSLLEIISNILDISKIEAGRLELKEIRADLPKMLEEALVIVRHAVVGRNIRLFRTLGDAFPRYAFVDPVRLRQVLVNLLGNAVKFTEEGEIELAASFRRISSVPNGRSDSGDVADTGLFTFSVRDTGIGLREEDIAKLFKPFSQVDTSSTRKYGGTGLGLVISNGILKQMGSRLEVESTPGNGSRFFFTLALRFDEETSGSDEMPEAHSAPGSPAPAAGADSYVHSLRPCTLLIAEDFPVNRKLLRVIMSKMLPSAEILEAENGEEAVQKFESASPDLIFMDMHMPVKNGCDG